MCVMRCEALSAKRKPAGTCAAQPARSSGFGIR